MGHTNSTANLSLPQFIGTDKPTWLGDINGAFSAIDSYAGTNDAAVAAAVSDASSAISQAAAAVNTANTANTTAGNASTAANNAVGVANTANAIAGTVDAKVGLLADLNTTDRTSIVNAINEVKADATGTTVIDTAASGQTYAQQLTQLYTAYQNLTVDQRNRSALITGDGKIFRHFGNTSYSESGCGSAAAHIRSMQLNASLFVGCEFSGGTWAINDNSSNTAAYDLSLVLI